LYAWRCHLWQPPGVPLVVALALILHHDWHCHERVRIAEVPVGLLLRDGVAVAAVARGLDTAGARPIGVYGWAYEQLETGAISASSSSCCPRRGG
jgi:hypothetical protein